MAYKVLAQAAPAATTNTDVYEVPSGKAAVCSTMVICNRDATNTLTYRIAVRPAGEAIADKHWIVYDGALPVKSSDFLVIGMTLSQLDIVTVYFSNASTSCTLFGDEA